jgi:hypothetical protein
LRLLPWLRLGLFLRLRLLPWLRLLLFGLGLLFVPLLLLSVNLDNSSGKRNKGGQGHYSKKFHVDSRFFGLSSISLIAKDLERSNVQARYSTFCADFGTLPLFGQWCASTVAGAYQTGLRVISSAKPGSSGLW